MYYLNDVHPKYEYTVYCRVADACPYVMRSFTKKKDVDAFLRNLAKWHDRYHQIYYIDNKGFKNEYTINMNGKYYKILRRPVNDWEEVD